jgi:hypothetical protein
MRVTTEPMLMMLPPSPRCFTAACVVSRRPSTLTLNCLVEVLLGDGLDGGELVDAGVVDEDVEAAVVLDGRVDDALGFRGGLGDVAAHGDGLAAGRGDGGDNGVRAGLAGGVVDDDGCAFRGERLGDGGSDALGCAGDDCDFACELAHVRFLSRLLQRKRKRPVPITSIVPNIELLNKESSAVSMKRS